MQHVLDDIQNQKSSRYGLWKMSGFALAAAIAGFVVLPNSVTLDEKPHNQVVSTPKLSPQIVEDLEMLLVLGEDTVPHGSSTCRFRTLHARFFTNQFCRF